MRMRMALVATIAWTTSACGPDYPSGHVAERPRVVAVRFEPPEATIGDEVSVESLVIAPEEWTAPVTVALWQCPATEIYPHGCAGSDGAEVIGETSGTLEVGSDWQTRLELADPYSVYLVVTADVSSGDGEEDTAIKRLVLTLLDGERVPNRNPVLEALLAGDEKEEGGDVRVEPGELVSLEPLVGDGSHEPYVIRTLDGEEVPTEEVPYVSYYASCGAIGPGLVSGDSLRGFFRAPEEGACTVWAILRDGRGGTDWRSRRIVVTSDPAPAP